MAFLLVQTGFMPAYYEKRRENLIFAGEPEQTLAISFPLENITTFFIPNL